MRVTALLVLLVATAGAVGASFVDFPPGRQFVLHGPWNNGSLLRNYLAHGLFRRTGRYSPRQRHVVVLMRADAASALAYRGTYLALERISDERGEATLAPKRHAFLSFLSFLKRRLVEE